VRAGVRVGVRACVRARARVRVRVWYINVYKKFMSAEGISGRKPYGLRTRMIERRGWKRLEANRVRIPKG